MKRNTNELKFAVERTVVCLLFLALFANGIGGNINAQENAAQKQSSGTAAKMRAVPDTPAVGERKNDQKQDAAGEATRSGVIERAKVRQNDAGRVVLLRGAVSVSGAANARDAADKFLSLNAAKFGIPLPVATRGQSSGLRITDESESLTGTHLTYKQFYNNLPVFDEQLKISVNKSLQVTDVAHNIEPITIKRGGAQIVKPTDEAAAIAAAVAAIKGEVNPNSPPKAEAGIVKRGGANPAGVFRVSFDTTKPAAAWVVFVDARTNQAISIENVAQYQTAVSQPTPTARRATAQIFAPNPIVTSGVSALQNDSDATAVALLNVQMKSVVLRDLTDSNQLVGIYANTLPTVRFPRASVGSNNFAFALSDNRFDEVMAYYWVTEATHYVHDIGFTKILNRSMGIDVDGIDDDNSFYSPVDKQLTFGSGGVHDAQDASIILHEFGHAILDAQVPGFGGRGTEAGAISEGFGDYFSASYFAGTGAKGNLWDAYVGTWDAVAYNPGAPAFLRRVDGEKVYPRDLDKDMEVHNNGEMWSSHLWKIFQKLGKRDADRLIIEAQFKLTPHATFKQNAEAIIATDNELNAGKNAAVLRQIFTERGILN